MLTLCEHVEKASFIQRYKRFIAFCQLGEHTVKAYLANPGRLWELLYPGALVLLKKNKSHPDRLPYTVMAVFKDQQPVLLHTHLTNDIAAYLIEQKLIPGLKDCSILKREIKQGQSRFDFLLQQDQKQIYVEVKSCTLFHGQLAMFPDAVTARGQKHVRELAALKGENTQAVVLFIIHTTRINYFLPEFHIDPQFSTALYQARKNVKIIPVAVQLDSNLQLRPEVKPITLPWSVFESECHDQGVYLLLLQLENKQKIKIGQLGVLDFEAGFYVYIGKAKKNLNARIKRHTRLRKNKFWHIDYLRQQTKFLHALAIRTSRDLECQLAEQFACLADWQVKAFGCSDCSCLSHLLGFKTNPLQNQLFIRLLLDFKMNYFNPCGSDWLQSVQASGPGSSGQNR